jgi:PAS domain S-box-containing protein
MIAPMPRPKGRPPAALVPQGDLRLLVDGIVDYGIVMLDGEGVVLTWNAGARSMTGYADHEVLGQHFSRFYPEVDRTVDKPAKELAIARAKGRFEEEGWRLRKNGDQFWASVSITALRDEGGGLIGYSKVTRDLTERRLAEERLRESEDGLRLMVESVRDYAIIRLDPVGIVSTWNLGAVDDLLDVERVAHGKVELRRRPIELAVAVATGVELALPLINQHSHRLSVEVVEHGLVVDADEARLAQVVSNLLNNAARYTPPGGTISLTAAVEGAEVVLRVVDSGVGIDAAMLTTVFDIFVQGAKTMNRKTGGLGLGLAIVRNLIALHGGTVSAASKGRDRGSEFAVRLPRSLQAADGPPAPLPEVATARAVGSGARVLIVDDNDDAAEMLADLIRRYGHVVEVAYDGPAALAVLERFEPVLIILDIGLPGMDGFEVARRIRALPAHETTTLIALTGHGQQSDHDRSRSAGFDRHLVKPVQVA